MAMDQEIACQKEKNERDENELRQFREDANKLKLQIS